MVFYHYLLSLSSGPCWPFRLHPKLRYSHHSLQTRGCVFRDALSQQRQGLDGRVLAIDACIRNGAYIAKTSDQWLLEDMDD